MPLRRSRTRRAAAEDTLDPRKRTAEPDTAPAEVDLLWRFREGDRDAFDLLVGEFHERLVQFFHRLCWDLGQSEDLTQSLFLKLLRSSSRYRPEGKLSTYIFRIATNLWIDHYRSARPGRRMFSLDQALQIGHEPSTVGRPGQVAPQDAAETSEEKERLRAALEKLTEPHRLVFELAVYQQLPYGEISTVLEIPVGTVKSRMHNTVKALREILDDGACDGGAGSSGFRMVNGQAGTPRVGRVGG
ncbi:MAG: RNA polymerase sigma factor [Planctomycetota bacterium]